MKFISYIFLLLGFIIKNVYPAVIGIDLGNEFFKVSMIAPGKSFVIVENGTSKRKTNTAISFVNKERVYEQDATNKRLRFP